MTKRELLELHFDNTPADLAKAMCVTKQAVNGWPMDGDIPKYRELLWRKSIRPKLKSIKKMIRQGKSSDEIKAYVLGLEVA